jgi:hypothetical protein
MAIQHSDKSEFKKIAGQNIDDIQTSPEAYKQADLHMKSLKKSGMNDDQIAELAWLTRSEILHIIQEQSVSMRKNRKEPDEPVKVVELFKRDDLQRKIAYLKKLLETSGNTMREEYIRHNREIKDINGQYLEYKTILKIKNDIEKQLGVIMAKLFAERGRDPDSMLVETRAILEDAAEEADKQIEEITKQNPDVAALIQNDKLSDYSRQLQKNDFVWTQSRKKLLDEALKTVVAGRPMIILMGESGTGKTAMANAIAKELTGVQAMREVGGGEARFKDSLLARAIDEKGSYYDFGPLLQAMTGMKSSRDSKPQNEGAVYFDDEFNTRPAAVQRQILKFIADAKVGRDVTVPGTDLKVKVQPKFLYIAAGNPLSARYEREETPVEAMREVAGVLNVDYLEQTKDQPELFELAVSCLTDQKTRRLRIVNGDEVKPNFVKDAASGKEIVDENPKTGGFLWRFSSAWKELLNSFSQKENVLSKANPADPIEKYYLQRFILDMGKVRGWLQEYKASLKDQKAGIEVYLKQRLINELKSYPEEDKNLVKEFFKYFDIDLDKPLESKFAKTFKVLTPKELGYLFPNVPRPPSAEIPEPPMPLRKIAILPDGSEVDYTEDLPSEFNEKFKIGDEIVRKNDSDRKVMRLLGITDEKSQANPPGKQIFSKDVVLEQIEDGKIIFASQEGFLEYAQIVSPEVPKGFEELIKQMDQSYDEMIDTLKDYKYPMDKVPDKKTVQKAIIKLGPEMLKKIKKFGKPTLLITPAVDLEFMKNKIDENKKYANANGELQNDTYFDPAPNNALWGLKPGKLKVTIVDGISEMPQLPANVVQMDWEHRHKYLTDEYKKQKMEMISSYEYAMLAQRSLKSFEKAKNDPNRTPEDEIIDKNTFTVFNGGHLTDLQKVPSGNFDSVGRLFRFSWSFPRIQPAYLRSRPSVQVLEI